MKNSQRSGFTIIEIMISVVLLSVGIISLASLQVIGMKGNVTGEDRGVAASIASSKLNEFSAMRYVKNSVSGDIEMDSRLASTEGSQSPAILVNQSGYTKSQVQVLFPGVDIVKEQFRYTVFWIIQDMGDASMSSSFKRISITVRWNDRSSQAAGDTGQIVIASIPIMPKYL